MERVSYLPLNAMSCINTKLNRQRLELSLPFCLKQIHVRTTICAYALLWKNIQFLYSICQGKSFAEPKKSDLHSISYSMQIFPKSESFICEHFLKDLVTMGSDGFWSDLQFIRINPKGCGGCPKVTAGREIVCRFSQSHAMVTKTLDFIHIHPNQKVVKSFTGI